jgi:hypothetical protein
VGGADFAFESAIDKLSELSFNRGQSSRLFVSATANQPRNLWLGALQSMDDSECLAMKSLRLGSFIDLESRLSVRI